MNNNILQYFKKTVVLNKNKKAVFYNHESISFGELDNKAKKIALNIINIESDINNVIGVFLPKSIKVVLSNLAITYSANAYMNLDVKTPNERICNIIKTIAPKIIITENKYLNIFKEFKNIKVILIDEIDFNYVDNDFEIIQKRLNRIIDTDPYCVINTSGSTGTPKGVVLNHRSFIDFTEWSLNTFKFSENEIIGSLSPVVFDIYSFELCLLMSRASTIVLIPENFSPFPIKILDLLKKFKVSFIFWVPTIMVNIANMDLFQNFKLDSLKLVWFAGEVFPTKQFNYWKNKFKNATFVNLYGPIEITLDCTYFIVNRKFSDNEPLPIGIPCKNTDVIILNENDELVKNFEEGELCVRGSSLAMGYYNNKLKTSSAFVQNPLNKSYPELIYRTGDIVAYNEFNEIVFKGRKDTLVKHLGYRIELGEIEHVILNDLKLVDNACVVYKTSTKEIILFYESKSIIDISFLRKSIGKVLPKYMIPNNYKHLKILPRNTNGKIDRLKLKEIINS